MAQDSIPQVPSLDAFSSSASAISIQPRTQVVELHVPKHQVQQPQPQAPRPAAPHHALKILNPDSICGPAAADTAAAQPDSLLLLLMSYERPVQQPVVPADWRMGKEGAARVVSVGDNSGVLTIVAAMVLLMMLSFKNGRRMFGRLGNALWGMRRRANAFDEHTSGETRTMILMAAQWCVYGGILLYSAVGLFGPAAALAPAHALLHIGLLIGLMAAYYLAQVCAYSLLGFVFSDSTGRRLLLQGFAASQALLGFALIVPALISIFYPAACMGAVLAGAGLYLIARIIFIIKGFRIFYTNFGSLLYFILYLCALEIIPLAVVAYAAVALVTYP